MKSMCDSSALIRTLATSPPMPHVRYQPGPKAVGWMPELDGRDPPRPRLIDERLEHDDQSTESVPAAREGHSFKLGPSNQIPTTHG
jgi:hypothetical protein